ncbi:unnamed protein product [Amoebophrya sp. A25]|nr:unnamed protein product [Amoebophrya sp. A25]|eukprot:GSA25T00011593001.1
MREKLQMEGDLVGSKNEHDHKRPPTSGVDFHTSKVTRGLPLGSSKLITPGPGNYNVLRDGNAPGAEPESFQFKSKTLLSYQRAEKEASNAGPGPGSYHETNTNPKPRWAIEKYDFGSKSERLKGDTTMQMNAVPGPGAYQVQKGIGGGSSSSAAAGSSGAGGATSSSGGGRASASYGAPKHKKFAGVHNPAVIMALQEMEGVPLSAFTSSDVRSCNRERRADGAPPPGNYYNDMDKLYGSITNRVEQKSAVGRLGVFGSRAERFPTKRDEGGGLPELEEEHQPGSARKSGGGPLGGGSGTSASASASKAGISTDDSLFRSSSFTTDQEEASKTVPKKPMKGPGRRPEEATTCTVADGGLGATAETAAKAAAKERIAAAREARGQAPGPGTYVPNLNPSYRNPYRPARQEHVSFGSSADRMHGPQPPAKPSPADYTPVLAGSIADLTRRPLKPGAPKSTGRSLKPKAPGGEAPGPGSYDLSKGLLKKSYNTTLNRRFA